MSPTIIAKFSTLDAPIYKIQCSYLDYAVQLGVSDNKNDSVRIPLSLFGLFLGRC